MINLCLKICEREGFINTYTYKLRADLTAGRDIYSHCTLSQELRRRYSAGVQLHRLENKALHRGSVWIEKHILTKEDRENLDFFTRAAWQHLNFPIDLDNRDNNKGNSDFDEDNNLSHGRTKDLIKSNNNADLSSLNNSID